MASRPWVRIKALLADVQVLALLESAPVFVVVAADLTPLAHKVVKSLSSGCWLPV